MSDFVKSGNEFNAQPYYNECGRLQVVVTASDIYVDGMKISWSDLMRAKDVYIEDCTKATAT